MLTKTDHGWEQTAPLTITESNECAHKNQQDSHCSENKKREE